MAIGLALLGASPVGADPVLPARLAAVGRGGDVTRAFGLAALLTETQQGALPELAIPAASFGERLAAVAAGHAVSLGLTVAASPAGNLDAPWFAEDRGTLLLAVSPAEVAADGARAGASPTRSGQPVAAAALAAALAPTTRAPAGRPRRRPPSQASLRSDPWQPPRRWPRVPPVARPPPRRGGHAAARRRRAAPRPLGRWLPGAAPARAAGFGGALDATFVVPPCQPSRRASRRRPGRGAHRPAGRPGRPVATQAIRFADARLADGGRAPAGFLGSGWPRRASRRSRPRPTRPRRPSRDPTQRAGPPPLRGRARRPRGRR
ncbi:MAG: hypothetical protein H6706_27345 [Myxococcales bacterium]|nr:hypothetical protein [Myxococcales bacterium]